jgi:hypothetical protein
VERPNVVRRRSRRFYQIKNVIGSSQGDIARQRSRLTMAGAAKMQPIAGELIVR